MGRTKRGSVRRDARRGRVADGALAFCPSCFERIPAAAETCAACGARIAEWSDKSYAERLILALDHPMADVRMRVITALGLRRQKTAAGALVACALRTPADVTQALAIVESLRRIFADQPDNLALRTLSRDHPSPLVREVARTALAADAGADGCRGERR